MSQDVVTTIAEINAYLQSQGWMDFEIMKYAGYKLVIMGSLDPSAGHDLEIAFEPVSFISLPMEWKTDTSIPPLTLLHGAKAIATNKRFRAEQGVHIFQFRPEDYPEISGCLVGARTISYKVTTAVT